MVVVPVLSLLLFAASQEAALPPSGERQTVFQEPRLACLDVGQTFQMLGQEAKEGAIAVGHAVKEGSLAVGHTAKEGGLAVGHAARAVGQQVGHGAVKVGTRVKKRAKKLGQGVKGAFGPEQE